MTNRDDEVMSKEGARNPPVDASTSGARAIRTLWGRGGEGHGSAEAFELPDFEMVRKGFSPGQVREYVTQFAARIRNLERQLEDSRQSGDRDRTTEQEFGESSALLERVEGLEQELNETRSALSAAVAGSQAPHGAEPDHSGRMGQLEGEIARLQSEVSGLQAELEMRNHAIRVSGGSDGYGAIASQVAELLRSTGLQAEQLRREATEEANRQIEEAQQEAGSIRREADTAAEAVRREAEQQSERLGADREEVLREARIEADRLRRAAETDSNRQRDETERVLLKARSDAERMLSASISRRDLVRAEMQAMRERLVGVIELLEPIAQPENHVEDGEGGNDYVLLPEAETIGAGEDSEA